MYKNRMQNAGAVMQNDCFADMPEYNEVLQWNLKN